MVFRGMNMPRPSSGFMALRDWPPLIPHPGRLMLLKVGGLATAVMRSTGWMAAEGGEVAWVRALSLTSGVSVPYSYVADVKIGIGLWLRVRWQMALG